MLREKQSEWLMTEYAAVYDYEVFILQQTEGTHLKGQAWVRGDQILFDSIRRYDSFDTERFRYLQSGELTTVRVNERTLLEQYEHDDPFRLHPNALAYRDLAGVVFHYYGHGAGRISPSIMGLFELMNGSFENATSRMLDDGRFYLTFDSETNGNPTRFFELEGDSIKNHLITYLALFNPDGSVSYSYVGIPSQDTATGFWYLSEINEDLFIQGESVLTRNIVLSNMVFKKLEDQTLFSIGSLVGNDPPADFLAGRMDSDGEITTLDLSEDLQLLYRPTTNQSGSTPRFSRLQRQRRSVLIFVGIGVTLLLIGTVIRIVRHRRR